MLAAPVAAMLTVAATPSLLILIVALNSSRSSRYSPIEAELAAVAGMRNLAEPHRDRPDAKVVRLLAWIGREMCRDSAEEPGAGTSGAFSSSRGMEWRGTRLPEVFYDPRAVAADAGARASLHAKGVVA